MSPIRKEMKAGLNTYEHTIDKTLLGSRDALSGLSYKTRVPPTPMTAECAWDLPNGDEKKESVQLSTAA